MLSRIEAGGGRPGSEEGRCLGEVLLGGRAVWGRYGGKDWLGCWAAGVREELWFCPPWRRPSLLSLFSCVQGILCYSPATDAVRSGYIVVRQKHHPLPAGWCQVIVVHPLPLWLSGKHPAAPHGRLSEPPCLAGFIVDPPGWVLLSQACSCSPDTCCFSPVAAPCPASPTPLHPSLTQRAWWGGGGGWLSRHFWGI